MHAGALTRETLMVIKKIIKKIHPPKPPKPVDRLQNMQTIRPLGKTKWVKAHWGIRKRDQKKDSHILELAVKRAELRGGLWSTAGKRVEKPLMQTLCKLYDVPDNNYAIKIKGRLVQDSDFEREVDFYLVEGKNQYKCEVKLMGRGNPESADAVIARDSKVFVADKLSETNKKQLDSLGVEWVELRNDNGFQRFEIVLNHLRIPHGKLALNIDQKLEKIFREIF